MKNTRLDTWNVQFTQNVRAGGSITAMEDEYVNQDNHRDNRTERPCLESQHAESSYVAYHRPYLIIESSGSTWRNQEKRPEHKRGHRYV